MSRADEVMPFVDTYETANECAGAAREEAVHLMTTSDGRIVSARGLWESGWDEACIRARRIIRSLESTLSARDAQIAELEGIASRLKTTAEDAQRDWAKARAEVPEYCQELVQAVSGWLDGNPNGERETRAALREILDHTDWILACGLRVDDG